MKWRFVPRNTGKPVYLVINSDESEPGTFKDRLILERDPHLLIEGMIIASYALVCVRPISTCVVKCCRRSADEPCHQGMLR